MHTNTSTATSQPSQSSIARRPRGAAPTVEAPSAEPTSSPDSSAGFLAPYFRDLATVDVMTRDEELGAATRITSPDEMLTFIKAERAEFGRTNSSATSGMNTTTSAATRVWIDKRRPAASLNPLDPTAASCCPFNTKTTSWCVPCDTTARSSSKAR